MFFSSSPLDPIFDAFTEVNDLVETLATLSALVGLGLLYMVVRKL